MVHLKDLASSGPPSASNTSYDFRGGNMKGKQKSRLTNKTIIYKDTLKYLGTAINNELLTKTLRVD
jgi:hypothetical protein